MLWEHLCQTHTGRWSRTPLFLWRDWTLASSSVQSHSLLFLLLSLTPRPLSPPVRQAGRPRQTFPHPEAVPGPGGAHGEVPRVQSAASRQQLQLPHQLLQQLQRGPVPGPPAPGLCHARVRRGRTDQERYGSVLLCTVGKATRLYLPVVKSLFVAVVVSLCLLWGHEGRVLLHQNGSLFMCAVFSILWSFPSEKDSYSSHCRKKKEFCAL